MAIGLDATTSAMQLNNQAGQLAVQLRNTLLSVNRLQNWCVEKGHAGLIAPPPDGPGFTDADADEFAYRVSVLNNVYEIWAGNVAQPDAFNFSDALAALTGPG